jgi:hypothetical protein
MLRRHWCLADYFQERVLLGIIASSSSFSSYYRTSTVI